MGTEHPRAARLRKFEYFAIGEGTIIMEAGAIIAFVGDKGRPGFLGEGGAAGDVVRLQVCLKGVRDLRTARGSKLNQEICRPRGVKDEHLPLVHDAVAA